MKRIQAALACHCLCHAVRSVLLSVMIWKSNVGRRINLHTFGVQLKCKGRLKPSPKTISWGAHPSAYLINYAQK